MNVGEAFDNVGRDGHIPPDAKPSKDGGHDMLMVGYIGNYYIVKNSWGADYGDNGYIYVPKKLLAHPESETALVAIALTKEEE